MTRRGAILAGAVVLVLLGVASIALARGRDSTQGGPFKPVENPHGAFTTETDYCVFCHSDHQANDDSLNPYQRDRTLCMQCHSGQEGAPNILAEYQQPEGEPTPGSLGHRVPPDGEGLACTQCHTPHQSAEENPGLLRARVINPDTGHKIYLYNADKAAIGTVFCYSCHGPRDSTVEPPPPEPMGDFTAFEVGAHSEFRPMWKAAQPDEGPADPEADAALDGVGKFSEQTTADKGASRREVEASPEPPTPTPSPEPPTEEDPKDEGPTGKIVCLFCHGPHDSDTDGLTVADEEALCFQCHTKADPNTVEDSSPYRDFNAGDNVYEEATDESEGRVAIFHHPIAEDEQQDGKRTVECVSCHNPHFDAATNVGNNSVVANPRRTVTAWPTSATKRGDPRALRAALRAKEGKVSLGRTMEGPVTYERWARALLVELEAPACEENQLVLVAWQTQEGTSATWNPLATTLSMPGATSINSSGVKAYLSLVQGLEATRLTLQGGSSNGYDTILASLRNCLPATVTAEAIRDSSWCRGCTDGRYLLDTLAMVRDNYETYAGTIVSGSGSWEEDPVETVNTFCTMCHVAPDETNPIKGSDTVPYGIHLVNDEGLDPGGQPHDLFEATQFETSLHAGMACTACHDVHGSSNAYALRERVTAPDGSSSRVMVGFGGEDRPADRQQYGSFCMGCHQAAEPHVERVLDEGWYCRECHYHGSEEF